MRKTKKILVSAVAIFLFAITATYALGTQNINNKAPKSSAWLQLSQQIKQTTSDTSIVNLTSKGGAASLGFRARGQFKRDGVWYWTNYGIPTNVTTTGTNNTVWFNQSFSATMHVYLSFHNNTADSSTPLVQGLWTYN